MMDRKTADKLGLRWTRAKGAEFGTYSCPGHDEVAYAGLAVGPIKVKFDAEVEFSIPLMKIFEPEENSPPLIIIGTDVLRRGRPLE